MNNAGYFPNRSIDDMDLPRWRTTIATNLDSHFLSAKYFLPTIVPASVLSEHSNKCCSREGPNCNRTARLNCRTRSKVLLIVSQSAFWLERARTAESYHIQYEGYEARAELILRAATDPIPGGPKILSAKEPFGMAQRIGCGSVAVIAIG